MTYHLAWDWLGRPHRTLGARPNYTYQLTGLQGAPSDDDVQARRVKHGARSSRLFRRASMPFPSSSRPALTQDHAATWDTTLEPRPHLGPGPPMRTNGGPGRLSPASVSAWFGHRSGSGFS